MLSLRREAQTQQKRYFLGDVHPPVFKNLPHREIYKIFLKNRSKFLSTIWPIYYGKISRPENVLEMMLDW